MATGSGPVTLDADEQPRTCAASARVRPAANCARSRSVSAPCAQPPGLDRPQSFRGNCSPGDATDPGRTGSCARRSEAAAGLNRVTLSETLVAAAAAAAAAAEDAMLPALEEALACLGNRRV